MRGIVEDLRLKQHRNSTMKNYYSIWKVFNEFFIKLDQKPEEWEDRITLFAAYLINQNRKSTTVRLYISAIKAVLGRIKIKVNEDRCLLNSLTRACKLTKDTVTIRRPIHKQMLEMIIKTVHFHFDQLGQIYLKHLYSALFATTYYGLFRVGEVTMSPHAVKACDVQIGTNKRKLMFILRSSKTHTKGMHPQIIKIASINGNNIRKRNNNPYCPFKLLHSYLRQRSESWDSEELFFVFKDRTLVHPHHFRETLKEMIRKAGFNERFFSTHSLRGGRAVDLMNMGFSVETIKTLGRWTSNSVYVYLKQ